MENGIGGKYKTELHFVKRGFIKKTFPLMTYQNILGLLALYLIAIKYILSILIGKI
jgi:hypothetical protein